MTSKPTPRKRTLAQARKRFHKELAALDKFQCLSRKASLIAGGKRTATPIITQRLQLLAEATARLAKAERLVKRWRREIYTDEDGIDAVRRCARQLSRILKP